MDGQGPRTNFSPSDNVLASLLELVNGHEFIQHVNGDRRKNSIRRQIILLKFDSTTNRQITKHIYASIDNFCLLTELQLTNLSVRCVRTIIKCKLFKQMLKMTVIFRLFNHKQILKYLLESKFCIFVSQAYSQEF